MNTVDNLLVRGVLQAGSFTPPANSVGNSVVRAGDPIDAEKLEQQYVRTHGQAHGTNATAERRVLHVAQAAGELFAIEAGVTVAATGNSTATVDLHKNGSTILSAPIVLDNTNAAYAGEAGTFSSQPYVAADVSEVVVTVSAGTGTLPQGVYAAVCFREDAE